jgi:hypothetical protein
MYRPHDGLGREVRRNASATRSVQAAIAICHEPQELMCELCEHRVDVDFSKFPLARAERSAALVTWPQ